MSIQLFAQLAVVDMAMLQFICMSGVALGDGHAVWQVSCERSGSRFRLARAATCRHTLHNIPHEPTVLGDVCIEYVLAVAKTRC